MVKIYAAGMEIKQHINGMMHNMKYGGKVSNDKVVEVYDVRNDKAVELPASGSDAVEEPPSKAMRVEVPDVEATCDDVPGPEKKATSEADLSELCFWVSPKAEILPAASST